MTDELDKFRGASIEEARHFKPGTRHYRAFVGGPALYDVNGAAQFSMMTALGLRESHTLLDIGCGSLSAGRLFIPYLAPDRYCGIEPNSWLIEDAIRYEITSEMSHLKRPRFLFADDFPIADFGVAFDFMLAHSVLTHTSPRQLDSCLSRAKLALAPNGIFVATFWSNGAADYDGEEWVYPGFVSCAPGTVAARAAEHGLVAHPFFWHTRNRGQYWIVFTHRGDEKHAPWLERINQEPSMFRVLELERLVNGNNKKLRHAEARLQRAQAELAALRGEARSEV